LHICQQKGNIYMASGDTQSFIRHQKDAAFLLERDGDHCPDRRFIFRK
jgi:hypothetical protein